MLRYIHPLLGFAGAALLLVGGTVTSAQAAPPPSGIRTLPSVTGRGINPNHPPGWDWWRTYPWSPYNAWRNPYWYPPYNANYPYPPNQAYPYPMPSPYPVVIPTVPSVPAPTTPVVIPVTNTAPAQDSDAGQRLPTPHITGATKAGANSALIKVTVKDPFAEVTFDGQKVGGVGTTRSYATPDLAAGKEYRSTVRVVSRQNGQSVTEIRPILMTPGQTITLDLAGR